MLSNPTFGAETYIILSHFSDLPNKLQRRFLRSAECLELCKLHNLALGEILGLLLYHNYITLYYCTSAQLWQTTGHFRTNLFEAECRGVC